MKQFLILTITAILFASCQNGKTNSIDQKNNTTVDSLPNPGTEEIPGVVTRRDGSKNFIAGIRIIRIDEKKSITSNKVIVDTIYADRIDYPVKDALGNTIKTKAGQDSVLTMFPIIGKDSFYTDISNKPMRILLRRNNPIDSLLKKI